MKKIKIEYKNGSIELTGCFFPTNQTNLKQVVEIINMAKDREQAVTDILELAQSAKEQQGLTESKVKRIENNISFLLKSLDVSASESPEEPEEPEAQEASEAPKTEQEQVVEKINDLEGITIEVIGSWVWVSGKTYPVKEALKEAGFKWASHRKQWYYRPVKAA